MPAAWRALAALWHERILYFLSAVSPQTFGFNDSVLFLGMLLIGGDFELVEGVAFFRRLPSHF